MTRIPILDIYLLRICVSKISKSGLRNLTRAMTLKLAEYGIRVNDVAPGMILTSMNQESVDDSKKRQENEKQIPIKRAGIPEDIANMVLYRCYIFC